MPQCVCIEVRRQFMEVSFLPSTTWVQGIELRFPGLVERFCLFVSFVALFLMIQTFLFLILYVKEREKKRGRDTERTLVFGALGGIKSHGTGIISSCRPSNVDPGNKTQILLKSSKHSLQ